jgi:hypothetical protein
VFTLSLFALSWWIIEDDRRSPSARIWLLPLITVFWVNLHGGFLALPITLGILAVGAGLERDWRSTKRYGLLLAACMVASIVNPYGLELHGHLSRYLRSDWLVKLVEEFRPPDLKSPAGPYIELLLVIGIAQAALSWKEGRVRESLLLLAWAHAALTSVRHVPIFAIVMAPLVAGTLHKTLEAIPSLASLGADFRPAMMRHSLLLPVLFGGLLLSPSQQGWASDFPDTTFPVREAAKHADLLRTSRLFTEDRWADYLAWRLYPEMKVFLDGRSDYFGPAIIGDYQKLMAVTEGWRQKLDVYRIDAVLLKPGSPLSAALKEESGWRTVDQTAEFVLLTRPKLVAATRRE